MTTLERQLREACPHSKRNGNEGYICLRTSSYIPNRPHFYSNKKCNGCFLMYPKPTAF